MTMPTDLMKRNSSRLSAWPTMLVAVAFCAACDLTVSNPGPVQDSQLNTPAALPPLVNGMSGDLSAALGGYLTRHAITTDELVEAGNFTPDNFYAAGVIRPEDDIADWAAMQTARWSAESGLARMRAVRGAAFETDTITPWAYLWAGFANRMLGENMCTAVIDGGPAQSDTVFFVRAESLFTRALTLAQTLKNTTVQSAALGGRASVRAAQGNWTGAVTDAALVPTAFVFNAVFSTNTGRENNTLVSNTVSSRQVSVFGTVYAKSKADPRTPWDTVKTTANGVQVGQNGTTPYFVQKKYPNLGSLVPLTKGTEMILLRAEAALRNNDVAGAMTLINQERAASSLPALTATTASAAQTIIQTERGAVLWLEGRRLWDLRRWQVAGTSSFLTGRATCLPVSSVEQGSNPNFTHP
ncbi:MAG: RagB/SusD family nutrient uptake outer membrane protein [Gemmatimonadaceae bacterium]